jgi:putative peptidoglycan lipid II flippase
VFYAVGLYGYSAVKVLAPAFYALDEARVPVLGSIAGMVANLALNLLLYPVWGYKSVALATSLAATVNFAVLAIAWKRLHGGLGGEGIYRHLARVAIAAAVLALVAAGTASALARVLPPHGLARQLALALVPIALAAAAYLGAARVLRLRELDDVLRVVKRRAGRRMSAR